jgi:hypothetical protein
MNKQQFIITALIGLALYLISTGISFAAFSIAPLPQGEKKVVQTTPTPKGPVKHFIVDPSVPRTEVCPLNGKMYTKQEKDAWEKRRPLAVMIENHAEARPQSGLSRADIVYEAVAEGGITRFMGVFYCDVGIEGTLLAPVRSARTYFLPWVLEYDALYNHVGGAGLCNDPTVYSEAKALCQIGQWKIKDMDQFGLPFKTTDSTGKKYSVCYRNYDRLDHAVDTEHTMVCDSTGIYKVAENERDWTNVDEKGVAWDKNFVQWKFKDDAKEKDRGASFSASFVGWKGYENEYGVRWDYNRSTNTYTRFNGGVIHKDLETDEALTASNIIILFAKETDSVDEHGHLLFKNTGSGDGILFQDGKATKITWKKLDRTSRTLFYDTTGKEVQFNRGQIWVEMLGIGTPVKY